MSLRNLLTAVVAILLISAVGGVVVYVGRRPPAAPVGPGEEPEPAASEPALEVQDFAPEHYEQGRPTWRIRLANLRVERGGRAITAGGLREGVIYDRRGRPAVRVTARNVKYDTVSYDFDVTEAVRVVSPRGALIATDKVHWDNASRTLSAPGRVVLRTKDDVTVTTAGLKFDTSTQTVYCPNQVRMQTGRSDVIGRNLEYKLENGAFTLRSVQMVIDIEEARERTRSG